MNFDAALIWSLLPEILRSAGVTLGVWLFGVLGAVALGFVVALGRRYGPRALGLAMQAYVELIRGTPFLIQLFLLY